MTKLKEIIKYIIIYLVIVLLYKTLFYFLDVGDSTFCFSFAHAMSQKEVIYKDFNPVVTPLYIIVMSLGLHISDTFTVYILEETFLLTIMYYYLEKLLGPKLPLFLGIILLPFPRLSSAFYMSYNSLVLVLFTILIYLEKEKSQDYLVGLIISLIILTKQTLVLLIIPMIILSNNRKSLYKRLIGLIIPFIIFFLYLLINNNLYDFINLCILGLFDFSKSNNTHSIYLIVNIILLIITIIFVIRHIDKKYIYYVLPTFLLSCPIFDLYHTSLYIYTLLLVILTIYKDYHIKYFFYLGIVLDIIVLVLYLLNYLSNTYTNQSYIKHFKGQIVIDNKYNDYRDDFKYFDKFCKKKNCIILGYLNMYYNINNDKKIDYFSMSLTGNHGYRGNDNLIKKLDNMKDTYIIIEGNNYGKAKDKFDQRNYQLYNYVRSHYKKVDSYNIYDTFYKE